MERDKKGRFVKKGLGGTSLNSGFSTSLNVPSLNIPSLSTNQSNSLLEQSYLGPKTKYTMYEDGKFRDQFGNEINPYTLFRDKYKWDNNQFVKDENGNLISNSPFTQKYQRDNNLNPIFIKSGTETETEIDEDEQSGGVNIFDSDKNGKNNFSKLINKEKLANWLDLAHAGIAAGVNNKIADRALEAEKPFLQDVSESHRSVYGDYRAQVEGEQQAAKLRNLASKPLTSDGAIQQQMMLDAQIKGNEYINQGNAQDESMIKQTREVAWQQEKENQQQRQAAAMQNRQAMMMTEKNKANIENARDSANYSQVIQPLLTGITSRIRQNAAEQDAYQEYYDNALIGQRVWNDTEGLTPDQIEMQNHYLNGTIDTYLAEHPEKETAFRELESKKSNRILQERAALKGVNLNIDWNQNKFSNPYGFNWEYENIFKQKQGGTIYKARLTKRISDNNRSAKSIESNKKIAARFLEKALDSLYTYNDVELIAKPKNKKKKYQAGGSLPFVSFTPTFATSEKGASISQKSEDKDDLTTKDILELLKDMDGLPSDMNAIISDLKNFTMRDSLDPLGLTSSSNIASQYIKIVNKIKIAKTNKEWYDKAYEKLRDNNTLNELAITNDGRFIGMNNEGDFKYFTAEEVASKNTENYYILTNSNLLSIRSQNPNAAFNNVMIQEIANSIGMEQITEFINKTIQNLGSDKTQTQVFGNQSKEVLAGLQQLQNVAREVGQDLSISQLYEANIMNENQVKQAHSAITYLINSLPSNMRALLLAKTGSEQGVIDLITSLVNSKLSSTYKLEFSPKNKKSATTTKSGNITLDGLDLSPAQMLQQGFGDREYITIQDQSSTGLQVEAVTMPITKDGNQPMGSGTLEDVATSQFGGILNFTNASMGGQIIPFEGRRNIAVDGSKIYSMYLPIDQDEYMKGNIVPDITLIDKVNKINKDIKQKQITDPNQINALYEEAGLPVYMNQDGTVIPTFYRRFGVINGTAIDNAFGKNFVENRYLKKIDDEDVINNALSIMNRGRSKEDRIEYDAKNFFNFGGLLGDYDNVYEGTIFIPISNDVFLGVAGSGKTITSTEANDLEALQQQKQKVSTNYINPGQLE